MPIDMASLKAIFFRALIEQETGYAILRNYDSVCNNTENDIDVFVRRSSMDGILNVLCGTIVGLSYTTRWLPDKVALDVETEGRRVSFDMHMSLTYYGLEFVRSDAIPNYSALNSDGIVVLDSAAAALVTILNRLLHKRPILDADWKLLSSLDVDRREYMLDDLLGHDLALILGPRLGKCPSQLPACRRQIIRQLRRRKWTNIVKEVRYRHIARTRNHIIPRGGMLVLIGTHGAGKSTAACHLRDLALAAGLQVSSKHTTSRPGLLPSLRIKREFLDSRKGDISATNTIEMGQCGDILVNWLHSLRLIYHFCDYWGLWALVRIRSQNELTILDRYFYDYSVEPRNTHAAPTWLRSLLTRLAPRPTLTAIIWNDPYTIFARKPELPVDELKRETSGYFDLKSIPGIADYKTDVPPVHVARAIFREFLLRNKSLPTADRCLRD